MRLTMFSCRSNCKILISLKMVALKTFVKDKEKNILQEKNLRAVIGNPSFSFSINTFFRATT